MHTIFNTLCRLLAPILSFTAEEAWGWFGSGDSIHVQEFFEGGKADHEAESLFNQALHLRNELGPHIEQKRTQGAIGSSQEASVSVMHANADELNDWWLSHAELLAEILIISEVRLIKGAKFEISVEKTAHQKCARCWRHRPSVGKSEEHPDLCDRCERVVTAMSAAPK
jgi:isoleucyl-tRNA synthetase